MSGGGARRGRAGAAAAVATPVSDRKLRESGRSVTLLLGALTRLHLAPPRDYSSTLFLLAAGRSSRLSGQNRFGPVVPMVRERSLLAGPEAARACSRMTRPAEVDCAS